MGKYICVCVHRLLLQFGYVVSIQQYYSIYIIIII